MDTPICTICLDNVEDHQLPYKLSCGHIFHFTCFKKYVFHKTQTFFSDCPNCKQLNTDFDYPFPDDYYKSVKALCNSQAGKVRCVCKTKSGKMCKKKSQLLNYGMCHIHNKDVLPKEKYEPLCKFIYHLLLFDQRTWTTKVFLLDVAKKLIIKFDDIKNLEDIYRYLFIYIADAKKRGITNYYKDRGILYSYYDLDVPPAEWVDFCVEKHVLF